jgi:hypothetical protein
MVLEKGEALLQRCEADLRGLVAVAAAAGDYDAVLKLTSWAKALVGLRTATPTAFKAATEPGGKGRRKAANGRTYPMFGRRADQLIKVGWSKTDKREYEHKAPKRVVMLLAELVARAGQDGRVFQVSALIPCTDPADGSAVPDYQIYLIIAWWRSAALVEQHGRQGYSLPNAKGFAAAVEHAWNGLRDAGGAR